MWNEWSYLTDHTILQNVQTVQSWLDDANNSVVDAKLPDHIVTSAQSTLRNAVRKNLEAPAKHFQYYCELFTFLYINPDNVDFKTYMTAFLEHL